MIAIIVVSHLDFASHLVLAAERLSGKQIGLYSIALAKKCSRQEMCSQITMTLLQALEHTKIEGALLLVDLFGSTQLKICEEKIKTTQKPIKILTGMNLPMLVSSITYRERMNLEELTLKVQADGKKSIHLL